MGNAIAAEKDSPLSYGSEFRPWKLLESIFSLHPLWPRLQSILNIGSSFPLEPLSREIRKKDLAEAIEYGNHKGVDRNRKFFVKLIKTDVTNGYSLIIPLDKVINIENALMAPMNIAEQSTIAAFGEIVPSKRLTHNQSKKFTASGTSVNGRVKK